jgi:hypothetical protein
MAKMKPCKECGAAGVVTLIENAGFVPTCTNGLCFLTLQEIGFETEEKAVEAWNNDFEGVEDPLEYEED